MLNEIEIKVKSGTRCEYVPASGTEPARMILLYHGFNPFNMLINEIDHETIHHILIQLEGKIVSHAFDDTTLQLEIATGFKNYKVLIKSILKGRHTKDCKEKILLMAKFIPI